MKVKESIGENLTQFVCQPAMITHIGDHLVTLFFEVTYVCENYVFFYSQIMPHDSVVR